MSSKDKNCDAAQFPHSSFLHCISNFFFLLVQFQVLAPDVLAMNPFLVHLANKVKEVYLYTVFLHPDALIISERHLDEPKEHTLYSYIMHIPVCFFFF